MTNLAEVQWMPGLYRQLT